MDPTIRLLTAAALLLVACGPSLQQRALADVASARSEAHAQPGARQAEVYADAIDTAYKAGAYRDAPHALAADVDDAIAMLEAAALSAGPDAPTLIAWRGLLLTHAARYEEAFAALERSMALGPNLMAARNLILIYGTANQPAKVGEVCAVTVPTLTVNDAYELVGWCMEHMNALSDEAALAWASPEIVAWYQEERERRAEQRDAELRAAEAQRSREQRVVRETEMCAADCKETGLACQNDCYGGADCEARCVEINGACLDRCESEAYRALGI
jgi:tetratricopeptide (TPR) repeat protein